MRIKKIAISRAVQEALEKDYREVKKSRFYKLSQETVKHLRDTGIIEARNYYPYLTIDVRPDKRPYIAERKTVEIVNSKFVHYMECRG